MNYLVNKCGIVILAAGKSSRLGSPKQLLHYQGKSLISHTVDVALSTGLHPVIVVLGANSAAIKDELAAKEVMTVENAGWEEGMASSLRVGLQTMQQVAPSVDGIIFLVCDQPFVTKSLLVCLRNEQAETGKPATASSYGGKLGTPALFHRVLWPDLLQLTGDTGARKLLASLADGVAAVPFEEGLADIDTKEDYERLLQ